MTIIDPKTAKRFVKGMLESEYSRLGERATVRKEERLSRQKANIKVSHKTSKMVKHIEERYRTDLGETFLYSFWAGRVFTAFSIMIVTPDDRPPYAELIIHRINLRSYVQNFYTLAVISTHAMERLLERRSEAKLLALLKEEMDVPFLNSYFTLLDDYDEKRLEGSDFKLNTATGIMCIRLLEDDNTPIFTTWYPQ